MSRKKQIMRSLLPGLLLLMLAQTQTGFAEIVVITHKTANVDVLTTDQVRALFLQKEKSFPGGGHVVRGDQPNNSTARNEFGSKVLGKSAKKLKRYWSKRVFAGKGVPPKIIGDDAAMKAWVAKTPNSLGYINVEALDDSVKVVSRP